MRKKIAVFLADGHEEIEALTVVDLCRRAGIEVQVVSVQEEHHVRGSHNICVKTDMLFEEVDFDELDMLVLPGGMPGTVNLEAHAGLMEQVDAFYQAKKYVAAICAAPSIFGHRGMMQGRKACCYPGFEDQLAGAEVVYEPCAVDGPVITGRSMGCAIPFALAIVGALCGEEAARKQAEAIVTCETYIF